MQSDLGLGSLTPTVSLLIFIHHTWMWDCPICHHLSMSHCILNSPIPWLCPSCLDEYGFFKSVAVGIPYSSISGSSGCFFVLSLAVILVFVQRGEVCQPMPASWLEDPKRSLKAIREKWLIIYKWFSKWQSGDILVETLQAERQWDDGFIVLLFKKETVNWELYIG